MIINAKTKTFLRLLHKYVGFIFSFFILILIVTGIMLLYPKYFGLDSTYLSSTYILKKYKMLSIEDVKNLGKSEDEIILLDKNLYYKETFIDRFEQNIKNAYYNKESNILTVVLEKKVYLYFLEEFENKIEVIDIQEKEFNDEILEVGEAETKNIIFKTKNNVFTIANKEIVKAKNVREVDWFKKNSLDPIVAKSYLEIYQGKGVSLHRVITEVHNGKIMGSFFTYILFLSSISLLFLIFSSFFFGINFKKEKK